VPFLFVNNGLEECLLANLNVNDDAQEPPMAMSPKNLMMATSPKSLVTTMLPKHPGATMASLKNPSKNLPSKHRAMSTMKMAMIWAMHSVAFLGCLMAPWKLLAEVDLKMDEDLFEIA